MKLFLKSAASIILIVLLLRNVEWELVFDNLRMMQPWLVVLVFSIFAVQFPISVWKWQLSLKLHQLDYDFMYLLKVITIGFFFNNFLPSSIGGDAYRVIKTMPEEGYKSRAISAVLLDRIIGFSVLVFFGFIGGLSILMHENNPLVQSYVMFCLLAGVAALTIIFLIKLGFLSGFIQRLKNIKKLDILMHNLSHIWNNPVLILKITAVSLLFQLLSIFAIGLLFDSLHVSGGYEQYALIAAIVGLASVIPLSINGIGIIEGAFAVSAVQLGLGYNEAIIVAFILRILVLPLTLACGLVYLLDGIKKTEN